ncbi:DnaJ (Hsp40), sub C, member 17 [Tieghemiomyces parasiticus]|uniref:DnaJ (Hsp40), sub C, member 17 n=1 Tax=Tieghemiomyces parasiticus TaxID=78921 RepID=A0A9W8A4T0_9FUNG|nr:DnaJ (Hsp40), sub C, member 17 [Tieghemiomyces parasiticus]
MADPTPTQDIDFYEVLGVAFDSTSKEITKAYRLRALKCHPDKNPDNPHAARQFHELSVAYDTLNDATKRVTYDGRVRAQQERRRKQAEMDTHRRRMKEDLERAERQAHQDRYNPSDSTTAASAAAGGMRKTSDRTTREAEAAAAYQAELAQRTRAARARERQQQAAEAEKVAQEAEVLRKYALAEQVREIDRSVLIKWGSAPSASTEESPRTEADIRATFRVFGPIDHVVMAPPKKKTSSALVVYRSIVSASSAPTAKLSLDDYEILTFMNLKTRERQKLGQQIRQQEDGDTGGLGNGGAISSESKRRRI